MQRIEWWKFWCHNKASSLLMTGMFGSIGVVAFIIACATGYPFQSTCCWLPFLLLAVPYGWQLNRLMNRDLQNARLGEVELTYDEQPEMPPSRPTNRLYVPKNQPPSR
jgi:hypothetical protein